MVDVVEIPQAQYDIGNESVPNAAPRHLRQLNESVWIDTSPISWAHFEIFVAAGGYANSQYWPAGDIPSDIINGGIDKRYRHLLEQAEPFRRQLKNWPGGELRHPLTGLNWYESAAVAHFFGARLPFEVEWEVAMSLSPNDAESAAGLRLISRFGCPVLLGFMQEWTLDAFASVYYRADFSSRGIPWSPGNSGTLVSVRGASPHDLYRHVSARVGRDPHEGHAFCGFRRVWDHQPTPEELALTWR